MIAPKVCEHYRNLLEADAAATQTASGKTASRHEPNPDPSDYVSAPSCSGFVRFLEPDICEYVRRVNEPESAAAYAAVMARRAVANRSPANVDAAINALMDAATKTTFRRKVYDRDKWNPQATDELAAAWRALDGISLTGRFCGPGTSVNSLASALNTALMDFGLRDQQLLVERLSGEPHNTATVRLLWGQPKPGIKVCGHYLSPPPSAGSTPADPARLSKWHACW